MIGTSAAPGLVREQNVLRSVQFLNIRSVCYEAVKYCKSRGLYRTNTIHNTRYTIHSILNVNKRNRFNLCFEKTVLLRYINHLLLELFEDILIQIE